MKRTIRLSENRLMGIISDVFRSVFTEENVSMGSLFDDYDPTDAIRKKEKEAESRKKREASRKRSREKAEKKNREIADAHQITGGYGTDLFGNEYSEEQKRNAEEIMSKVRSSKKKK